MRTSVLLTCGALATVALAGCSRPDAQPATGPRDVTVFYTCDTRGNIHACDCTGGSAGGIARRATYLKQHPAANRLLVDAGNVGAGAGERDRLDLDFILRGYRLMGYDAINVGRGEATLGVDRLRELAKAYPEVLSANLVDDAGQTLFPPYLIRVLPNGLRVGIVGVLDAAAAAGDLGPGLRVLSPEDALARHLPELRKKSDLVVVLAYADERRMQELAGLFYEIGVMIGGMVEQPLGDPLLINRSLLVAVTDKGKTVGRLDLAVDGTQVTIRTNDITTLYAEFTNAVETAGLLEDYAAALSTLTNAPAAAANHGERLTPIRSATP